jgi:glutamate racemase
MIGVFDSGVGGLCALKELRHILPREELVYLADRKNAPYGTKCRDELIRLCEADIARLIAFGAERVLIACCTASTVYPYLKEEYRRISTPIISPAAAVAAKLSRVAVIGTEATVRSGAFGVEIGRLGNTRVYEFAHQELVECVESGCRDGRTDEKCRSCLREVARQVESCGAEGLILGCTHFSHLSGELSRLLPDVRLISPATEGARALCASIYRK